VNKSIPKENTAGTTGSGQANSTPQDKAYDKDTSIDNYKDKYKELGFYFDNDIPKSGSASFKESYDSYISQTNIDKYVNMANTTFSANTTFCKKDPAYCENAKNVKEFFSNVIKNNYKLIAEDKSNFIVDTFNILKDGKGKIKIQMVGAASATASNAYNKSLSERRLSSVRNFLKEFKIGDANLAKFIENKDLEITLEQGNGETEVIPKGDLGSGFPINCTNDITGGTGTVTSNSQIFAVNAMACRRVKINNITVIPTVKKDEKPAADVAQKTITTELISPKKPEPTVTVDKKLKEGIGKLVLRKLLTECDYFDVIQKEVPFLYDSIKEKIRYFNPAFHLMTFEGLNARLNFLNQCVRPGETIPIIGTDGKPKFNDAVNTSFGAPPVLVLRIGDFYHTKIIPDNVSFTYEPLIFDMNPEGIGVQPMIVNVSMTFKMIGGHGLAKPVEQLQNALSFNYYANTEIYDERAVWTEDTSALDKTILDSILNGEAPATVADVDNQVQNDGGTTIGDIITNIPVDGGQEGEISYRKIMDKLLDSGKTYFTTITNQLEKVVLTSNYGVLQLLNQNRLYTEGSIIIDGTPETTDIWGKGGGDTEPTKLQGAFDNLFKLAKEQIDNEENPLISKMVNITGINDSDLTKIKNQLKNYVISMEGEFSNSVFTTMQDIVNQEQDFVQVIRKVNLISGKVDGKIMDTGVPRVYNISDLEDGDTKSYDELWDDISSFTTTMSQFYGVLTTQNIITDTYSDIGDFKPVSSSFIGGDDGMTPEKVFYMIISRIFSNKDKLEQFKSKVIDGLTTVTSPVNLSKKFNKFTDDLASDYNKELSEEEKLFSKFKKSAEYKKFTDGIEDEMYKKGKDRKFKYNTFITAQNDANSKLIKDLYSTVNVNKDKKTFDGKVKFD